MPFIKGERLSSRLETYAPKADLAVLWVTKLAVALGMLHDAGNTHDKFTADNVIIDQSGEPMLMDVGVPRKGRIVEVQPSADTLSHKAPKLCDVGDDRFQRRSIRGLAGLLRETVLDRQASSATNGLAERGRISDRRGNRRSLAVAQAVTIESIHRRLLRGVTGMLEIWQGCAGYARLSVLILAGQ